MHNPPSPQPDFWEIVTALTAVLALVVSLWRPVANLFKGRKLRLTTQPRFTISHYMGHPQLYVFLDIQNVGGQSVTISRIDCYLKGEKVLLHLPAETYYSQTAMNLITSQQPELIIGSITLKPDEHWRETIRAFETLAEVDDQTISDIASRIRRDVNTKLLERQGQQAPAAGLVEAAPDSVAEATQHFIDSFKLTRGTYQFIVGLISDTNQILLAKAFEFTLYDNTIRDLKAIVDDYKYGAGGISYWDQTKPSPSIILRPLTDSDATRLYEKAAAH